MDLTGANLTEVDLTRADLTDADLTKAVINEKWKEYIEKCGAINISNIHWIK